jgi:hypothetical protein
MTATTASAAESALAYRAHFIAVGRRGVVPRTATLSPNRFYGYAVFVRKRSAIAVGCALRQVKTVTFSLAVRRRNGILPATKK